MRTVCVGGGPAGLYFSILSKLRNSDGDVTVLERHPGGITHGWGVTFSHDVVDCLRRSDHECATRVLDQPASWGDQVVRVGGRPTAHLGGHGFGIGRHRMLNILTERAVDLGVDVRFEHNVTDLSEFADADLIVACDGANSRVRRVYSDHFRTTIDHGRNKYIWLGTHKVFDEFVYAFEPTRAGWVWFYAYPFDGETTTFIVECTPETWTGLGLAELDPEGSRALLESIFARHLDGHSLLTLNQGLGPARWRSFTWVTNESWYHDNVVLMGDAAHTTHYSIGSGTKLAIEDAVALDRQLGQGRDLPAALRAYESERSTLVSARQSAARSSARWFENLHEHIDVDPVRFAYSLRTRQYDRPPPAAGIHWVMHRATQLSVGRRARRWASVARRRRRERSTS